MAVKDPGPALASSAKSVAKQADEVTKTAKHVEASAGAVERSAEQLTDSADRRTVLAADRTLLAGERTYAAWIRTGLVALASGLGAHAVLDGQLPHWLVLASATAMIAFSMFCYAAAVWRNFQSVQGPTPDTPRLPRALFIGFSVLLTLVAGACLLALYFG